MTNNDKIIKSAEKFDSDIFRLAKMKERNRLRRMYSVCVFRWVELDKNGYPSKAARLRRFADKINIRIYDLADELGFRW